MIMNLPTMDDFCFYNFYLEFYFYNFYNFSINM